DLPRYVRVLNLTTDPVIDPPWVTVHDFLSKLAVSVPDLYAVDKIQRAMLVEDVGSVSLVGAVTRTPSRTADLYRAAVETLFRFHVDGTRQVSPNLLPSRIAYDGRLFRWELTEFLDLGCAAINPEIDRASLVPDLDSLAAELGQLPRVFSHRDFHGLNLFVQEKDTIRVIDFQDALMAPSAQDMAVLMTTRDMGKQVSPSLERRLLEYYYTGLIRRTAADLTMDEFIRSYRLCVLQHALKMIGRFLLFERDGKRGYSRFVPHAIAQARRMLSELDDPSFSRLRIALA